MLLRATFEPFEETARAMIVGTWSADDTSMTFESDGMGAMAFNGDLYALRYTISDHTLSLDFYSSAVIDCKYTISSISTSTLVLIGGSGTTGGTFTLTKV